MVGEMTDLSLTDSNNICYVYYFGYQMQTFTPQNILMGFWGLDNGCGRDI